MKEEYLPGNFFCEVTKKIKNFWQRNDILLPLRLSYWYIYFNTHTWILIVLHFLIILDRLKHKTQPSSTSLFFFFFFSFKMLIKDHLQLYDVGHLMWTNVSYLVMDLSSLQELVQLFLLLHFFHHLLQVGILLYCTSVVYQMVIWFLVCIVKYVYIIISFL